MEANDLYGDHGVGMKQVKVTRKIRVRKQTKKVKKCVLARRQWAKFGEAANASSETNITMTSTEEILLERTQSLAVGFALTNQCCCSSLL